MPLLYIGNVTHQRHEVYYRLDFITQGSAAYRASMAKKVSIEPGQQIPVGGDLLPEQAQIIMDQLSIYGGLGVDELKKVPPKRITYLMSYGKAIPAKLIHMADEHNKYLMANEGDLRRRNAAIAAHPVVDNQIDNLKRFDVEMIEVPPEAGDPDPVGKPIDFGAHIDPTARETPNQPPPPPRLSRAERRRNRG